MKTLSIAALLIASLGFAAAADVSRDYDHKVDFGQYKTYSWLKVDAGNPLWTDRITESVDKQLAAKGWTKVQSGAGAAVAAMGSTRTEQTIDTFYNGFGGGWAWRGFGDGLATTTVHNTKVGNLLVDIFDANSKKLIWRATAEDALSEKPEKNIKKLDDAVKDMFDHFPPKGRD
jgi:opacity protein-like surface antigen